MSRTIQGVKCCVIGGAGFLGSHLVDHLIKDRDCEVLVLDNLISGKVKYIHEDAKFIWHDIRQDEDELVKMLKDYPFVFNYAAEPLIDECFSRPLHFFDINATAVLRVLNACQEAKVEALLQVSSAEIYGATDGKISESAMVEAHSTYGVSKLAADGLVQVRWKEAKVPAIAMRQFNCVGPRLCHDFVVPAILTQLAVGPLVALGNNSTRDFLASYDAVRMAVSILEHAEFGSVINMGSEEVIQIYDLARLLGELWGYPDVNIVTDEARVRPWEIWHLQSDNTKLYETIPLRPELTLKDALQQTITYFRDNGNRWSF